MKEMSDQVRGVVFVLVAMLILFLWQHYYRPPVAPPPPKPAESAQTTPPPTAPPAAAPITKSGTARAVPTVPVVIANEEKTVVVESPLYRVELSNRGGVVKSWKLKKFFDDQKPPRELDLVNADVAQELGWPFSLFLSDPQQEAQANLALYKITPATDHFNAPATITFHWSDGRLEVTKKLSFNESYEMSVETAVNFDGPGSSCSGERRCGFSSLSWPRPAEQPSAILSTGKMSSLARPDSRGRLSPRGLCSPTPASQCRVNLHLDELHLRDQCCG